MTAAKFKRGDKVRFKKPSMDSERGTFTISKCNDCIIGQPCYFEEVHFMYPPSAESLELVRPTSISPLEMRIIDLEERVEKLERLLKQRL